MDIWVFSDESGTFDYVHHDYFVYGGVIISGKQEMDILSRKYIALERKLRQKTKYKDLHELKAFYLDEKDRRKLLSIFKDTMKFAVIIREKKLDITRIFKDPKTKQHYLDFAYKLVLRRAFEDMVARGSILPSEEFSIRIHEDNHHIKTSSRYSKEESIFTEFREGLYRSRFGLFYPPVFENLKNVSITLHDSRENALIRGADIIANAVYVSLFNGGLEDFEADVLFHIEFLP